LTVVRERGVGQHWDVDGRGWILVVDDHVAMAENIAEVLEGDGYRASVAASALEALALFDEKTTAVITDFRMAGGNGAELITELRRRGSRVPAVVMTALADEETELACTTAGVLAILSKPVAIDRLRALVSAALPSAHA